MTRPNNRQQAAAAARQQAAAAMAMTGAVDLGGLKERAEAERAQAQRARAQAAQASGAQTPGGQTPGGQTPGAQPPAGQAQSTPPAPGNQPPASPGAVVLDVTEETFEADVLNRSMQQLVVVDLWAEWCGPCKQLSPVLERLAAESGGRWVLAKVDVDANPRIAQAFRAQSIPMVVAIVQGQPVTAFNGVRSEAEITTWLDEIFAQVGDALPGAPAGTPPEPQAADPRMLAAEDKLNDGDFDGALADYRAIAEAEPENVEAASAARNLEFILRAQAHDPAIVDTASPRDVDAQLAAADVLLLSQQPEAAFERIIDVVRVTNGEERTRARTRLLELFELFDPAEPFVVTARRKLASALY